MAGRNRRRSPFTLFSFQDIITSVTGIMLLLILLLAIELLQRRVGADGGSAETARRLAEAANEAREEIERLEALLRQDGAAVMELAAASPETLRRQGHETRQQIERLRSEVARAEAAEQAQKQAEDRALAAGFERGADRRQLEELQARADELREKREQLARSNRLIYNPVQGDAKQAWIVELSEGRFVAAPLGRVAAPLERAEASAAGLLRAFRAFLGGRNAAREYIVLIVKPSAARAFAALESAVVDSGFDLGFDLIGEDQTVIDPQTGAGYQ